MPAEVFAEVAQVKVLVSASNTAPLGSGFTAVIVTGYLSDEVAFTLKETVSPATTFCSEIGSKLMPYTIWSTTLITTVAVAEVKPLLNVKFNV